MAELGETQCIDVWRRPPPNPWISEQKFNNKNGRVYDIANNTRFYIQKKID